ncbi:pentapeptide repeat-containing protein, partial [Desulfobacterales bacterium HSG16]|nr:pentapeptide repeat-containing protein [Desulfobacterales bacterium HSG16]
FLKTEEEEERTGIFAFPRGRGAGTCLHDIFEHLDFTCKNSDVIQSLLNEKLVNHGFDEKWTDTVREMVIKVLSVPLGRKSEPRFSLSMIPKKERIDEMEFHFPLSRLTPDRLRAIFSSYPNVGSSDLNLSGLNLSDFHVSDSEFSDFHFNGSDLPGSNLPGSDLPGSNLPGSNFFGSDFQNNSPVDSGFPEMIGNLKFAPSKGYMKGYIDLLFRFNGRYYIIDWKSNDLGADIEDYHWKNLLSVMKSDYYILQYHIYTLAVHQYLSLRIPDYDYNRHFGGIFYVFLRGVDPDKGMDYGIFKDRPPKDFVIHLKNSLIHESSEWHSF